MPLPARTKNERYTYADYLTWPDNERWELIDGVAFDMTPAPSERHQRVLGELFACLHAAVRGGPCRVYPAPFDVRLPGLDSPAEGEPPPTVVQPDITVVCDPDKLDEAGCLGGPDLVVEVLSPSTAYKDQTEKLVLFEKHAVPEYWIVNPDRGSVLVYRLGGDGRYGKAVEYLADEAMESVALPGVELSLAEVFRGD